jgi:PUA domain protein
MIRHHLSKKDVKAIKPVLEEWGLEVGKGDRIEVAVEGDMRIILLNGQVALVETAGRALPALRMLWKTGVRGRTVTVDEGAVKHVLNGANIFSAGVVSASPGVKEGDVVVVVDPEGRPLAVGVAEMDGAEMVESRKGMAVRNLHYVGDRLWKMRI